MREHIIKHNMELPDNTLLSVKNLHTYFFQDHNIIRAVEDVSFSIPRNRTVAIVGESGCGKTITAHSIINLVPGSGKIVKGEILFRISSGEVVDITKLPSKGRKMQKICGNEISMIFQEPMVALDPVYRIKTQIREVFQFHRKSKKSEVNKKIIELLTSVGMPSPEGVASSYPFQLSGGMCQRAMIAMALAAEPQLLICDEPTTTLDVTIQDQVLKLIEEIKELSKISILFITHNLAVVSELADEVIVMYFGKTIEGGKVNEIFENPRHPYTRGLLNSVPALGQKHKKLVVIPGELPSANEIIVGCPFEPRCSEAKETCRREMPPIIKDNNGRYVRCWLYDR